jgi:hypothetical protein
MALPGTQAGFAIARRRRIDAGRSRVSRDGSPPRRIVVGLAAFVFFVVPWMLVAAWLFRSSNPAVRMGLPATPWRPLTDFPPPPRDQRTMVDTSAVPKGAAGHTGDDKHRPFETP